MASETLTEVREVVQVRRGRSRPRRTYKYLGYTVPLIVVIFLGFNLPLFFMLRRSALVEGELTSQYYSAVIHSPVYMAVIFDTLKIAAITTVICTLIGYPLALWVSRLGPKGRALALLGIGLPFLISILVRTYSWVVVLGNNGIVNRTLIATGIIDRPLQLLYNTRGVLIGTINILLPFMVLPLYVAMTSIDNRLIYASRSLGASPRQTFQRVFLPLTLPALGAGCILVFILTFGFFVTPAILGGGRVSMIANMLDTLVNRMPRWNLAAAISTVLLAITLTGFMIYQWLEAKAQLGRD